MSDIENRISRLSASKRRLLELYMHQRSLRHKAQDTSKITECHPSAPIPLTFTQESMWFLSQRESDFPFYNISTVFKLTGNLNFPALNSALENIVARHEILRTIYTLENGQVIGKIQEEPGLDLPLFDLSDQSNLEENYLDSFIDQYIKMPFDLTKDLPLRCALFRLVEDQHIFLIVVHHIACDNWSSIILLNELSEIYTALVQGRQPELPQLPIQFADYVTWQRADLTDNKLSKQLAYWQEHLKDAQTNLELPADHPRPTFPDYTGGRCKKILPGALIEGLRLVGQQEKATLFMIMLAAFNVLIHRYTQEKDISLGSPIAGRYRIETENLLGNFINTLVLRCDLSGDPSFLELLRRVRHIALDAYANQDVPFEKLLEVLQPERRPGSTPLFQVMFDFLSTPPIDLQLAGLQVSRMNFHVDSTLYDLILFVGEDKQGHWIEADYQTCLFEAYTIRRMLDHYQVLLESILEDPHQSIHSLRLLSPAQERQLLIEWSSSKVDYIDAYLNDERTIVQIFEGLAQRTPQNIAVVYEDQDINYAELNARANQLARYLRKLGVGPDVPVGVAIPRSIEMVIALLGVLKAGGAYLPLDVDYPSERLSFILSDARSPVLLTLDSRIAQQQGGAIRAVSLDMDWQAIYKQSSANISTGVAPQNLAYIIYTSGSTGIPKGVMVPHSALSNQIQWVQSAFHLQEADKFLQKTPFTFDASVWEIFAPLLAGAQLVMAEPEGHADPAYLITTINRYSITHLQVVPSLLQLLVADDRFTTCKSLKTLFCGGETLSADLVGRVSTALNIEIVNLYGPTETCINATFWAHSPEKQTTGVPIGLPTANLKVYVLDPYLNPVPVGAPGELYIGGRGLARGYLNRPELTAEKFIPNPFAKQNDGTPVYRVYPSPGDRLYRTGDLVRFLPDGNLDFLGRIDNQVKLRGFRIELGEIESILNQHPGVRQAVAIVKQERTGDSRLVVYLIPNPEASSDPAALTEYLKARLPAYMLPSAFVFLDAMPLTTSGKVDRRALPATATVHSPNLSSQDVPRTPLEQVLAGIFSQVLGVQSVGLYDNFFDLGGHSLLAIRLNSHITDVFKLGMPLRSIFEAPTVAELAERMLATPGESQRIEKAAQLLIEVAELSETEAYSRLDQIKKRSNQ